MRTLAIGDIHGCLQALTALLDAVAPRPEDRIIALGDYVDRGPDSKGVLDYLVELHSTGRLIALQGNHDEMMADLLMNGDPGIWLNCGGRATLRSYGITDCQNIELQKVPESHWDFLEDKCINYYETEKHIFVHANLYPDVSLDEQPGYMLLWEKLEPETCVPHMSGKIMICGHTRQTSGNILNLGHAICLDTAAYANGWLTCLEIETGAWWQANQAGEMRTGRLTP